MANLEKIVDELSSLTVLEAAELAKVVGTAVGLVFNFTGSKFFVFKRA